VYHLAGHFSDWPAEEDVLLSSACQEGIRRRLAGGLIQGSNGRQPLDEALSNEEAEARSNRAAYGQGC
jgi:hypothetical protein